MAVRLEGVRRILATNMAIDPRGLKVEGDRELFAVLYEGAELGRVWAGSATDAAQDAIDAWMACGGTYTTGLTVARLS